MLNPVFKHRGGEGLFSKLGSPNNSLTRVEVKGEGRKQTGCDKQAAMMSIKPLTESITTG